MSHSNIQQYNPYYMTQTQNQQLRKLDKLSTDELTGLKAWLKYIEPYMFDSVSTYAKGRRELQIRNFVKLASSKDKNATDIVTPIDPNLAKQYQSDLIEKIGERLLPGFHQALVLYYPAGTLIKPHRDSPAYAKGAASVNVIGNATFLISDNQEIVNMQPTLLGEGDCIWFDNKQPHAIAKVTKDRWCVCFFHLKELINQPPKQASQLALFPVVEAPNQQVFPMQTTAQLQLKQGDKIQYKHPDKGWIDAIFESFHVPTSAPQGSKWSFIEIAINNKPYKVYSLSQIRVV